MISILKTFQQTLPVYNPSSEELRSCHCPNAKQSLTLFVSEFKSKGKLLPPKLERWVDTKNKNYQSGNGGVKPKPKNKCPVTL